MEKKEQQFVREITNMEDDFAQWYTDIITKADLVDYSPVKGFMAMLYGRVYKILQTEGLKKPGIRIATFLF